MYCVHEINDIGEIESLRKAWRRLLAETPGATFFLTPEWLETYWRHSGEGLRLRLLVVEERGEPCGIVPLVVLNHPSRLGKLKLLSYPLEFWGSFYSPIGPRPECWFRAALEHVNGTRRDWHACELRFVDHAGIDGGRTAAAMETIGWRPYVTPLDCTSILDLHGDWEQFLAARGSKFRNNFKRWERRLSEQGEIIHERWRPTAEEGAANPRWDLYETCEAIAERSWQGASRTGTTLSHEPIRKLLRDMHATAASIGCVDLNLLHVGGKPAAFAYNYVYRGSIFGLRIGYDPAVAKGVGNVLYLRMIEDEFARGDHTHDFGPGSLEIKKPLRSREAEIFRVGYYPHRTLDIRTHLLRLRRIEQAEAHADSLETADSEAQR